jgi:hypothetical protein
MAPVSWMVSRQEQHVRLVCSFPVQNRDKNLVYRMHVGIKKVVNKDAVKSYNQS